MRNWNEILHVSSKYFNRYRHDFVGACVTYKTGFGLDDWIY
jgi:hypothetical protein